MKTIPCLPCQTSRIPLVYPSRTFGPHPIPMQTQLNTDFAWCRELLMVTMPGGCNKYRAYVPSTLRGCLASVPVHPACTNIARVLSGSPILVVVAQTKRCLEHIRQVRVPHHVIPEVVENGRIVGIRPRWCSRVVVVCVLSVTKIDVSVELHLSSSHGVDRIRCMHVIMLRWHDHSRRCLWCGRWRSISFVRLIEFRNRVTASFRCDAIISGRLEELQSCINSRLPFAHFVRLACVIEQRHQRYHASLEAEPYRIPPREQVRHALLADVLDCLKC
jgi:hypothetical protein